MFEAGDRDGCRDAAAAAVDGVRAAEVIVPAQASMAGAADRHDGRSRALRPAPALAAAAAAARRGLDPPRVGTRKARTWSHSPTDPGSPS
ncbi:hypothetical protein [Streptomyces sp. NPDC001970]